MEEIARLNVQGIDTSKLFISAKAHLITSCHVTMDKVTERVLRVLGKANIGATGRGIGPTYSDKIECVGISVQDLVDESLFAAKS